LKKRQIIGFIGTGIMGTGMVHNLLLNEYDVNILAHKNRAPIDRLVSSGAKELYSLKDIARQSDIVILCLPNSETVKVVLTKIISDLENDTLLIDW
jgi:3-hydroxyisobutyrate dehydrogenase-like beta-hydroxyacid dehydrogenase